MIDQKVLTIDIDSIDPKHFEETRELLGIQIFKLYNQVERISNDRDIIISKLRQMKKRMRYESESDLSDSDTEPNEENITTTSKHKSHAPDLRLVNIKDFDIDTIKHRDLETYYKFFERRILDLYNEVEKLGKDRDVILPKLNQLKDRISKETHISEKHDTICSTKVLQIKDSFISDNDSTSSVKTDDNQLWSCNQSIMQYIFGILCIRDPRRYSE